MNTAFTECCMLSSSYTVWALVISIPTFLFFWHFHSRPPSPKSTSQSKSIMQPARTDLAPPKDDPFTTAELAQYDGSDASKPIYVAIKGAYNLVCFFLFFEISKYWMHFCKVISLMWRTKPIPMAQENLTIFSLEKTVHVVLESQAWRWRTPLQIIVP